MLSLLNLLKTIGFVDWNWKGHHPTYLKNLGGGFLEAGWRVAAFCPSGAVSELIKYTATNKNIIVDSCRLLSVGENDDGPGGSLLSPVQCYGGLLNELRNRALLP